MELMYDNNCGPVARYSDAHLFLVLDILQRRGHIGRKGLMEDTGLGEGSTKGMLKAAAIETGSAYVIATILGIIGGLVGLAG